MKTEILSKSQQKEFERPPKFNMVERRMVFEIPDSLRSYVRSLESTVSIVCFTLQYGYFKSSGRFFYITNFYQDDIDAICRWNKIDKNTIDWSNYHKSLIYRQQKMILKHFGKYASKQEHLQVTACKTLIHNLIICWNYMYLSKHIFKEKPEKRQEIFQKIKQISPVRWEHINFYGVFDFSDEALKNALAFDPEELFNFEIE